MALPPAAQMPVMVVTESTMWKRILAQVCRICPVCILRRRYPDSAYGRLVARLERHCVFCKAYNRIRGMTSGCGSASGRDRL